MNVGRLSPEVPYHHRTHLGDEPQPFQDQIHSHHYPPSPQQFYTGHQGLRDVSPNRGNSGNRDENPRSHHKFRDSSPRGQRGYEQGYNGDSLTQMMKRYKCFKIKI